MNHEVLGHRAALPLLMLLVVVVNIGLANGQLELVQLQRSRGSIPTIEN